MKGANFCPVCGKTNARFIKGFCQECFVKKSKPVEIPEQLEIEQCTSCGKVRLFGKMVPKGRESLSKILEKKVKIKDLENATVLATIEDSEENLKAKVLVKGIVDNVPLAFEKEVSIIPKLFQCDACMRLGSQYFEAIIQLRNKEGSKQDLEKVLPELIKQVELQRKKDSLAAVTEVNKINVGFDLKVGSKKAAQTAIREIKKRYSGETRASSTLTGVDKSGMETHRFTFLIRV